MEASALQAPAALTRSRLSIGSPLLRLRSDDQLVALFRAGNEEAFRVIHERYHQRLFAYARQMLPGPRQDAEDALQDIFVRAYSGLRSSDRQLALRAWLYRVAHNRCVDELRRPAPPSPELMEIVRPPSHDPIAEAERRESLRRLVQDVRRLPEQQRSALLMRELGGMPYADLSAALGVSVPAVKSLLVRARIGLAHAMQARDTACQDIRHELTTAYDRGVRPSGLAKRHMHDCAGCRSFRRQMRSTSRQLAALVPVGPLAMLANVLGFGGGAAGGGGGGAAAAGGVAGTTGAVASIGAVAGGAATHVATILAAAVVTAGGAVEIQRSVSSTPHPVAHHSAVGTAVGSVTAPPADSGASAQSAAASAPVQSATATPGAPPQAPRARSAVDTSGGPLIPAVDQLNPAATADSTGSAAGSGSSTAGGPSDGASGATGTGTGTTQPTTGTGSGEGTYAGLSAGVAGSGTGNDGTGSPNGSGPTSGTGIGSPATAAGGAGSTGSAGSTSAVTTGGAHSLRAPAAVGAVPATAPAGATAGNAHTGRALALPRAPTP